MRCVLLSPGPEGSGAWVAQGDEMAPWAQGTGERWTAWSFWLGKRIGKPLAPLLQVSAIVGFGLRCCGRLELNHDPTSLSPR